MDDDELAVRFGATLRRLRKAAGQTQRSLGVLIGVDQTMLSQWESGTAIPTLPRVVQLEGALGLAPGSLLVGAGLVEAPRPETDPLNCCGDALFWCPTSGEMECRIHGGYKQCCDQGDRHLPIAVFEDLLGRLGRRDE